MSTLSRVTTWPDFPKGLKVLLLDGSIPDKECTEALLKEASYEVTTCSSSAEAVSQLKQPNGFHLVLADYRIFSFETGDNLQLLRLLKKSRKTLAFLLLSDSTCPADVLQGVKLGAAEVIPKPLSPLKARTLWQHTVRKMMVKSRPSLDLSVDDSDSNSLEQPRTPSADVGCDAHQSCEACSSDSTSDLPDMLSFDLDCEDFSLDQIVGIPESSMSLTDKPPTPDSFGHPAPAHPAPAIASPSPSPPSAGSNSLAAAAPAAQQQHAQDSCTGYPVPAASTCPAVQQATHEQKAAQPAAFNMQQAHMGMQAMAVGGFPMWGMPPMPLMPGMMPGCPPFMMPPFMRPFGPMPMPPMGMPGMPMMPFPMCPMPLGMPPMMYPPPGFQFPYGPQLHAPAPAAEPPCTAPAAPSVQQPCWGPSPTAGVPFTGQLEASCASAPALPEQPAPQQPAPQQQQQQQEPEPEPVAPQQEPVADGQDSTWASFWMDAADNGEPPLGLQLKKSNSLLDLLSQHLFSTGAACT